MTLVVATGVFEIIHPGHLLFLNEARKLGTRLVVIVARDSTVAHRKRRSFVHEEQRLEMVNSLKMVDHAVLGDEEDMFKPIEKLQPDILALGFDQDFEEKELSAQLRKRGLKTRVVRLNTFHAGKLSGSKKIIEHIKTSGID
jgi:FAD synthetase